MKAQLVLQVPLQTAQGEALVVTACDDDRVIAEFADRMLQASEASLENLSDVFEREYARIRHEQLQARLAYVLGKGDQDTPAGFGRSNQ